MKPRARLIGLASLLGFGWPAGCNGTVTTASSPVTAGDIIGVWQNVDPNTSSVAQLQVHVGDNGHTLVHGYGACGPILCDWGDAPLVEVGHAPAGFYVNWSLPGNVSENLVLSLSTPDLLQGTLSTGNGPGPPTQSSSDTFMRAQ